MNRLAPASRTVRPVVLTAAAGLLAVSGLAHAGQGAAEPDMSYRVVARDGHLAPGGSIFAAFGIPRISADGRVAFQADLAAAQNGTGIWAESAVKSLGLVAREGMSVPSVYPTTFGTFEPQYHSPVMRSNGDIAFGAPLVADNINEASDIGILTYAGGQLSAVALPWYPAPGAGGALYTSISNLPSYGEGGDVAFYSSVAGAGTNAGNDTGLWVGPAGGLELGFREGSQCPQYAAATFGEVPGSIPLVNAFGEVAVRNYIATPGGGEFSIWRGAPGSLGLVAVSGQNAPVGGTFQSSYFSFGNLSMNDQEDVSFPQSVANMAGLWLKDGGTTKTIVYSGQPGPNGLTYDHPDTYGCMLDSSGAAVFQARFAGVPAGTDWAVLRRATNGTTQIIAREGDHAPGFDFGVAYGDGLVVSHTMNAAGAIIHGHKLVGPGIGEDNDTALFLTVDGQTEPVIYESQLIKVNGFWKTVESFSFTPGSGPESGRRGAMSELNQIALRVDFTDGTQAIIVVTPNPDCPGDLNHDGVIDSLDLNMVLASFGDAGTPGDMPADTDLDGDVDSADLNVVLANFGDICNPI